MIDSTSPSDLARLAARLHDPPEKALVLMRTSRGHEGGTVRSLEQRLFPGGVPEAVRSACRRADRWASAADRAAYPKRDDDGKYPAWQQVRFDERPVIIHPLTGEQFDLRSLSDLHPEQAETAATAHLESLVQKAANGQPDLRATADAFWRFGPELDAPGIRSLWSLLPADTRVPDHTIFDHLDLAAAFASAFAADPEGGPALLSVSIGPVQDFIAASRSVSDLWAGSHLLSRLSWEAMRVICEAQGPEAVLFPRLRGVPLVDRWLRDSRGLGAGLFEPLPWTRDRTDANPLFAAALPNRFVAIVPESIAPDLARRLVRAVREFALDKANAAWDRVLEVAGEGADAGSVGRAQIAAQLDGFPEVTWTVTPWSLIDRDDRDRVSGAATSLAGAMQPFFEASPPGYLGSRAWQLLSGGMKLEEGWFWQPNPGTLYPAMFELAERVHAAAKSERRFGALQSEGWRCTLTGEHEWITTCRDHLRMPPGSRTATVWARAAGRLGIKTGEHLGAQAMLKRVWPALFVDELKSLDLPVQRFVVSTHTMALAASIDRLAEADGKLPEALCEALDSGVERVALPPALARKLRRVENGERLARIPGWLDAATDEEAGQRGGYESRRRRLKSWIGSDVDSYYGLLLLDGDEMGAWLSAATGKTLPLEECLHPHIKTALGQRFPGDPNLVAYAREPRGATPARHMAISEALNHFSLSLAPAVIEHHLGRLVYSGGDDVLALLPAGSVLRAAADLSAAYRGMPLESGATSAVGLGIEQAKGFVRHRGRLMRLMGDKATVSAGVVIAHHQAPLGAVLRQLREAESRAKTHGQRNAWSLSLIKRSGGVIQLTAKWEAAPVFERLRAFLSREDVSRRAVYNTVAWIRQLPVGASGESAEMLSVMLTQQFLRQSRVGARDEVGGLCQALANAAMRRDWHLGEPDALRWLRDFLLAAEFLAREVRDGQPARTGEAA